MSIYRFIFSITDIEQESSSLIAQANQTDDRRKTAEEPDPQKELLYEKLSELPEDDQKLYRLYFIEERSQEEIAKMKGMSQNTISKKLRRIKKQLIEMCRKAV